MYKRFLFWSGFWTGYFIVFPVCYNFSFAFFLFRYWIREGESKMWLINRRIGSSFWDLTIWNLSKDFLLKTLNGQLYNKKDSCLLNGLISIGYRGRSIRVATLISESNTFHIKSKAIKVLKAKNFATLLDPPLGYIVKRVAIKRIALFCTTDGVRCSL